MSRIIVDPQATPNPNAIKFNVSVPVTGGGSESYSSKDAAAESPLARRIFELNGVDTVFLLGNFVTVNKTANASWNDLVPDIAEIIEEELGTKE